MVIQELKMDLVCPDSCFQAPTAEECLTHIMNWNSSKQSKRKLSLGSAIETLFQEDMDQPSRELLAELGILNLFALVSGKHTPYCRYLRLQWLCDYHSESC